MHKFTKVLLVVIATVLIAGASAAQKKTPPPRRAIAVLDAGKFQGDTYANKFLGISFRAPETWEIANEEFGAGLFKIGQAHISGKNAQIQKLIDDAPQTTRVLAAFKKTIGSVGGANFIASAEVLRNPVFVTNGADFLRTVILGFKNANLPPGFVVSEEIKQDDLGKLTVPYFETSIGGVVKQRYYALVRKGYGVGFILSYSDDKDFQTMRKILLDANFSYK